MLRQLVQGCLVVGASLAILGVVVEDMGRTDRSLGTAPVHATRPVPDPATHPDVVVPQQARPGERLTVLAYRNRTLCGPAQFFFDDAPAATRIVAYAGPRDSTWINLVMILDVPASATPGRHEIKLYGPVRDGRGSTCHGTPEHQGLLATTSITVSHRAKPAGSA